MSSFSGGSPGLFYKIFGIISCMYIAPGQGETTLGDNFIFMMEVERSYLYDHWLHVSKTIFAL